MSEQPERGTAQFPPGTMLDDKYRIDRLLAIGGMGAVYVGSHTKLKKKVAIKVLRTELANAEGAVERFQREAIAASQIGHDNIVEVTDLGTTEGGVAFLVMEYLDGTNLSDAIKKNGPMRLGQACDIAVEILSAMAAAHEQHIIHRDLKPENVFLAQKTRGETVKILDFGISRMRNVDDEDGRLTQTGTVMGTPYYMSPEQARGDRSIGPASDIYSTGVILYEMLTGSLPYEADTFNMVMFRVISGEWVKPRQRRSDLPAQLEEVICKAMHLEPEQRFATAAEFAAAIDPFAHQARMPRASQPPPAGPATDGMSTAETMAQGLSTAETMAQDSAGTADTVAHDTGQGMAMPANPGTTAQTAKSYRSPIFAIIAVVVAGVGATLFALKGGGETKTESADRAMATQPPDVRKVKPPAPAMVEVTFAVTPDTAVIKVDGVPIEGNVVRRERSDHTCDVTIAAEGFVTKETQVSFDVNQRIQLELEPVPEPAVKKTTKKKANKKKSGDDEKKSNKRIISDSPYD